MSSESSAVPADSAWLQQQLQQLLASPYIHFNHPPGIRMGHGPVDLFSTRFNNLFAPDASGTVAGTDADRAALKQALLALQKHWSPDSASFAPATGLQDGQVGTRAEWTPPNSDQPANVTATATVAQQGPNNRISTLSLDGDQSLFTQ